MPIPIVSLSTGHPTDAVGRDELADHGDDEQPAGQPEHRGLEHRLEVGGDADADEEDRDEDLADRTEVGDDPLVTLDSPECEAGHERTDDEGQLGHVGDGGEREDQHERDDHERRAAFAYRLTRRMKCGTNTRPTIPAPTRNNAARPMVSSTVPTPTDSAGHRLHDHGEDHQAEHVVDDRRAEDDPRLVGVQRAEVAEHPGGDPDTRRGERGADEHRRLRLLPERERHAETGGERDDHPDHRDRGGDAAHTSQVDQVHLHADEEQQQQHAHLGEHLDRHAAIAGEFDPARAPTGR